MEVKREAAFFFVAVIIALILAGFVYSDTAESDSYEIGGFSSSTSGGESSSDSYEVEGTDSGTGSGSISSDSYEGESSVISDEICGDGIVEGSEQCDDGNTASGDGCSSTCTTETTSSEDDSSGGGGGGSSGTAPSINLEPSEFNINLAVNTTKKTQVTVTNNGNIQTTMSISHTLGTKAIINTSSITIPSGESRTFEVIFAATDSTGIFTGKIFVDGYSIPVSLNIKTKLLLFDSHITVLNSGYLVEKGENLLTKIELIPMGDDARLDVELNYLIKDFENNTYISQSEMVLVDNRTEFERSFDVSSLPLGDYIVGLELVYPNGVATSSADFTLITKKGLTILVETVFYLLILIIVIIILIILVAFYSMISEKKGKN